MLRLKASNLAVLASVCLLGGGSTGPARADALEWSGGHVIDLGPGTAYDINDAGQVVGTSGVDAVEWSGGHVIKLVGLPGSYSSVAIGINNAGVAVGDSQVVGNSPQAVEWSGGHVIDLWPGGFAYGINAAGQVVGISGFDAVEWSGGHVIDLWSGQAYDINDAGQVVGSSGVDAVEWSGGHVIKLVGLPGSYSSVAIGINNAGVAVGTSSFHNGSFDAVEWSGGHVIDLGPGAAYGGINDAGQVVGTSGIDAVEWSGGHVIDLWPDGFAHGINDAGQVVGEGVVPEVSTWAMMLLGFAGLGAAAYAGRRRVGGVSRRDDATTGAADP